MDARAVWLLTLVLVFQAAAQSPCPTTGALDVDYACYLPAGSYSFTSIRVGSFGSIECRGQTTAPVSGVTISVAGNVTVAAGGAIHADATGYGTGLGPNAGRNNGGNAPGGGANGGQGHIGGFSSPAPGYVLPTVSPLSRSNPFAPTDLGSGGGAYAYQTNTIGFGGGAIKLTAVALQLDGRISANAANIPQKDGAGNNINTMLAAGAGGSLWLVVDSINGTGTIEANGGRAGISAGCGSGGRIMLSHNGAYTLGAPPIAYSICSSNYWRSGAGTVVIEDRVRDEWDVRAVGRDTAQCPEYNEYLRPLYYYAEFHWPWNYDSTYYTQTEYSLASLRVAGGANIWFSSSTDILNFTQTTVSGDGTGHVKFSTQAYLAGTFDSIRQVGVWGAPNSVLYFGPNITVVNTTIWIEGGINTTAITALTQPNRLATAGIVNLYATGYSVGPAAVPGLYALQTLIIQRNATVRCVGDPATGTGVTITADTVAVNGWLSANSTGYAAGTYNAGIFSGPGVGSDGYLYGASGAGYGGMGMYGAYNTPAGVAYGSDPTQPTHLGSGGGPYYNGWRDGSMGGGAIHLITRILTMSTNGKILANGGYGSSGYAGGGSGGSLWIEVQDISGNGLIEASGGAGGSASGGCGGGGRIALYYQTASLNAIGIVARSACGTNDRRGGAGTIYYYDITNNITTLRVSQEGAASQYNVLSSVQLQSRAAVWTASNGPRNWVFDNLIVEKQGYLFFPSTQDSLFLTPTLLQGDNTGMLEYQCVVNALAMNRFEEVSVRGLVNSTTSLPASVAVNAVTVGFKGSISGLVDLTIETPPLYSPTTVVQFGGSGRTTTGPPPNPVGRFVLNSITVQASALLEVHGDFTYTGVAGGRGVFFDLTTMTIENGGTVSGSNLGFPVGLGPGAGGNGGSTGGSGGGFGGHGGVGANNGGYGGGPGGGVAYGVDARMPIELGSGAGAYYNAPLTHFGFGGSALRVRATTITVDGTLSMDGGAGTAGAWAGGAGGSIYLNVTNLHGGGTITSNGGNAGSNAGCGSGGRIALYFASNTMANAPVAMSQCGTTNNQFRGAAGTVYSLDTSISRSMLVVDNGGADSVYTVWTQVRPAAVRATFHASAAMTWSLTELRCTGYGHVTFDNPGDTVTVTHANLRGDNTSLVQVAGTLEMSTITALRMVSLHGLNHSAINVNPSLTIIGVALVAEGTVNNAAAITVSPALASTLELSGAGRTAGSAVGTFALTTLLVHGGGRVLCVGDWNINLGVTISATTVTIETGATVSADSFGFPIDHGPGAGPYGYFYGSGGGGFGGQGAQGGYNQGPGAAYAGDATQPVELGSGSGNVWGGFGLTGWGAGAIHLSVATLTIDGVLTATGGDANTGNGGGGAGGSLWIEAGTLAGAGVIRANGGNAWANGGCGGGGRIAIYYTVAYTMGNLPESVSVCYNNYYRGGAGTVLTVDKTGATPIRRLRVSNLQPSAYVVGWTPDLLPWRAVWVATATSPNIWSLDEVRLEKWGNLLFSDPRDTVGLTEASMAGDNTADCLIAGTGSLGSVVNYRHFAVTGLFGGQLNVNANLNIMDTSLLFFGAVQGLSAVEVRSPSVNATSIFHVGGTANTVGDTQATVRLPWLTVRRGAEAQCGGDQGTTANKGAQLLSNGITVDAGGSLNARARGYGLSQGIGQGVYSSGGSFGGQGSPGSNNGFPRDPYGIDPTQPTELGSGAGQVTGGLPGFGGGAIHLVVGNLVVNGEVSSDGQDADPTRCGNCGGGSGGSVWIDSNTVSGSGAIRARGGKAGPTGGSGGGGRVGVWFNTSYTMTSNPDASSQCSTGFCGAAGTVYMVDRSSTSLRRYLVVDNNNNPPYRFLDTASFLTIPIHTFWQSSGVGVTYDKQWSFEALYVQKQGNLYFPRPTDYVYLSDGTVSGDASGRLTINCFADARAYTRVQNLGVYVWPSGYVQLPYTLTVANNTLFVMGAIEGLQSFTTTTFPGALFSPGMQEGTSLVILHPAGHTQNFPVSYYQFDEVSVEFGTAVWCTAQINYVPPAPYVTPGHGITILINSITVAGAAHFGASGGGYRSYWNGGGPGAGYWGGFAGAGGGALGGRGAPGTYGGTWSNIYGNPNTTIRYPDQTGSCGGGVYYNGDAGGWGGGQLRLIIFRLAKVTGSLAADGQDAKVNYNGGGGSGGSLMIEAKALDGQGEISTDGGGVFSAVAACGGGGRLAVFYETSTLQLDYLAPYGIPSLVHSSEYRRCKSDAIRSENGTVVFEQFTFPYTCFYDCGPNGFCGSNVTNATFTFPGRNDAFVCRCINGYSGVACTIPPPPDTGAFVTCAVYSTECGGCVSQAGCSWCQNTKTCLPSSATASCPVELSTTKQACDDLLPNYNWLIGVIIAAILCCIMIFVFIVGYRTGKVQQIKEKWFPTEKAVVINLDAPQPQSAMMLDAFNVSLGSDGFINPLFNDLMDDDKLMEGMPDVIPQRASLVPGSIMSIPAPAPYDMPHDIFAPAPTGNPTYYESTASDRELDAALHSVMYNHTGTISSTPADSSITSMTSGYGYGPGKMPHRAGDTMSTFEGSSFAPDYGSEMTAYGSGPPRPGEGTHDKQAYLAMQSQMKTVAPGAPVDPMFAQYADHFHPDAYDASFVPPSEPKVAELTWF